jgi:hypothetical protein
LADHPAILLTCDTRQPTCARSAALQLVKLRKNIDGEPSEGKELQAG